MKNPIGKWFTPQEARVIIFVLAALLIGSMTLMLSRKLPLIAKDVNVQSESKTEAAQDTTYESPGMTYTPDSTDLAKEQAGGSSSGSKHSSAPALAAGAVNLNTAPKSLLTKLPGVGPKRADDIIKYREKNGPFKSKKDIKKIKGIGDKTYEKMKK